MTPLTDSHKAELKKLSAQSEKAVLPFLKRNPKENELHNFWAPGVTALHRLGFPPHPVRSLQFWGDHTIIEVGKRKYVGIADEKLKVASLLRLYKIRTSGRNEEGEANCMMIFQEGPKESGATPPEGVTISGQKRGRPYYNHDMPPSTNRSVQSRATPLGKKGIVLMHSFHQTCASQKIQDGPFQRFLLGPTIADTINRAALLLRRLAGADPKSFEKGRATLHHLLAENFSQYAIETLKHCEAIKKANTKEDVDKANRELGWELPSLALSHCSIDIVEDSTYGIDPRTFAVSLETKEIPTDALQKAFADSWKSLIS